MKDWIAYGSSLLYYLGVRHVAQGGPHLPARFVVPHVAHLTPEESDAGTKHRGFNGVFTTILTRFHTF